MDWAYFNFGPKLILGIKSSPKSKSIQLIKSIKWAKGNLVISPHLNLLADMPLF